VKDSKGLVVEAAASSWEAKALMLLSVSMVNVILNLLCSALFAVMTWITLKGSESKVIS